MIGPEADRMNRDAQLPELRDGVAVDAAGIIATIGQENDSAERHRTGLRGNVAEAVADAGGAIGSGNVPDTLNASRVVPEFVQAELEFLFELGCELAIKEVGRIADSRGTRIGDAHTAGIVNEN